MRVLALDPGLTTGFVCAQTDDFNALACATHSVGQVQQDALLPLLDSFRNGGELVVVAETFRLIPSKARSLGGQRLYAVESLTAIRQWCVLNGVWLVEQLPAVIGTVKRPLLELAGLWEPTRGLPHARDASRHLVVYCLHHKEAPKACTSR